MRYKKEIVFAIIIVVLIVLIGVLSIRNYISRPSSSYDGKDLTDIIAESETLSGQDGEISVVCFGNAPFSDDRNMETGIADMLENKTGVTVYNLAIANSYASSKIETFKTEYPFDVFSFYWMVTALCIDTYVNFDAAFDNMDAVSNEMSSVYTMMQEIDMATIDAIIIMYDGSDYVAGRSLNDEENPTDIQTFEGALNAGIQLVKAMYPDLKIILASPTYAYSPDEYGNNADSNTFRYNEEFLYDYVLATEKIAKQNDVSFLDMYYLTNEKSDYLTDYIHLSEEGRKIVANRMIEALFGVKE